MNDHRFLRFPCSWWLAAAAISAVTCLDSPTWAAGPKRPNVLFIIADDLNTELGCYGAAAAHTPNIDRLARSSACFDHAYVQQALCNPSRASLWTGLRPDTLGIWNLKTHFRDVRPDIVTLPQLFKENGYFTQGIGKIFHNGHGQSIHGDPQSWTAPQQMHWGAHWQDWYIPGAPVGTSPKRQGAATQSVDVSDETYFDGRICELAVKALQTNRDRPFFLTVGFWKPHLPFNAPKMYWDRIDAARIPPAQPTGPPEEAPTIALHNFRELRGYSDMPKHGPPTDAQRQRLRHGYYAAVSYLDAQVGKLLDELDRLELADNTIVVFTSDHGFHLGEHGLWCKTSNFERDAHVPLLMRVPGTAANGKRLEMLVELADLYPTLAALAGLSTPGDLDGREFSRALQGEEIAIRKAALTQHPRPPYYADRPPVMGYSIRTRRYRYTEWREQASGAVQARELYDEAVDPHESVNLAAREEMKPRLVELAGLLEETIRSPSKREASP